MTDEKVIDMKDSSVVTVTYSSADEDIATVDANGTVSSGTKQGVTVITAEATINGESMSTTYPVVNQLVLKPSSADVNVALDELKAAYDKIPKDAYSDANLAEINKIYNDGVAQINAIMEKDELSNIVAQTINKINSIVMDKLEDVYSLNSVNENHIVTGVIDYSENGIGTYNRATGTITNSSPKGGIMMQAKDAEGNTVSGITWQIKKFDKSVRKVADINSETGELTIYGNGIIQITAADIENKKCGVYGSG